jgi:hypothetical protein
MSKILSTAAAIIIVGLTVGSAPVLAANHPDYRHTSPGYARPVYSQPRGGGFAWSAQHHNGYDGSRYWWGGDCWPTEPGGCAFRG